MFVFGNPKYCFDDPLVWLSFYVFGSIKKVDLDVVATIMYVIFFNLISNHIDGQQQGRMMIFQKLCAAQHC